MRQFYIHMYLDTLVMCSEETLKVEEHSEIYYKNDIDNM